MQSSIFHSCATFFCGAVGDAVTRCALRMVELCLATRSERITVPTHLKGLLLSLRVVRVPSTLQKPPNAYGQPKSTTAQPRHEHT